MGNGDGGAQRVVVHLGLQKTGTTSLHHFLGRNRAALAGRVAFRLPERGTYMRKLGRAALAYSLAPDAGTVAALTAHLSMLRDDLLAEDAPVLLVSHENLAGAMPGLDLSGGLYPALTDIIGQIDRAFAPRLPDYVIYTRDMVGWKRSVWAQAVETDGYAHSYDRFLAEMAPHGDWQDFGRRVQSALGDRVVLFRLEDEADRLRPGGQLLRHLGLTDADLAALSPIAAPRNAAPVAGALDFLRHVNALGMDRRLRSQVAQVVLEHQALFVDTPAVPSHAVPDAALGGQA